MGLNANEGQRFLSVYLHFSCHFNIPLINMLNPSCFAIATLENWGIFNCIFIEKWVSLFITPVLTNNTVKHPNSGHPK